MSTGVSNWLAHGELSPFNDETGSLNAWKFAAHGTTQGLIQVVAGGSFATGFVSGVASHFSGEITQGWSGRDMSDIVGRTMVASTLGGLASAATGGDFLEGAMVAATVHLYNDEAGRVAAQKGNGVIGYDDDGVPIFDESHPKFHYYYGSNSCLKTSAGCTFENGKAGLLRFPAPGASGQPIADEQTGFAIPVGTVRHEVYDGGAQVINVTLEGRHILHPGIVRRWVTQDALSVTIHTYGEGTGAFPRTNEFFSDSLWKGVDNNIFDYMSQQ